ncbi:hypothetical protein N658DRAFT_502007 [Parathielavia hyrcaniae]|uniref:Uncharacterized protein n=1 Tax=Parathielavia hyrcaniae TaxID=113614 RepID=A0AAN6SW52_9PEZI|nr:hypothetical protein N658DRAFT_502007 [Parathielavia hyrcaniae]
MAGSRRVGHWASRSLAVPSCVCAPHPQIKHRASFSLQKAVLSPQVPPFGLPSPEPQTYGA